MAQEKILVVDDDADILEALAERLDFYGFSVSVAADGIDCMNALQREVPDLLILDIRMPRMDGLQVLDRLRSDYPKIPVLVLSASSERKVAEETRARGAVDYMLKPFEPEVLKNKINAILKRNRR